jgi:hypothetical protein
MVTISVPTLELVGDRLILTGNERDMKNGIGWLQGADDSLAQPSPACDRSL